MNDQVDVDVDVRTIREAAGQIARWRDALITMLSDEQRQAYLDGSALHRLWEACEERGLGDASLRIATGSEVCVDVNRSGSRPPVAEGCGSTLAEAADDCRATLERGAEPGG